MSLGQQHLHARWRLFSRLEPFPALGAFKRFLDYLMYGVGIVAPIALVPQIWQIYSTRSAAGVSLFTWSLLTVLNVLWAIYAAVHKDKQLFFANAFIVLFDLAIVIGILRY
ncbi:hypothetical protein HY091_02570 [Candidatus Kaiserbacteria bacterium]|nr:hypothetical protein [Candidatus Kaiserbacteria bacterium]